MRLLRDVGTIAMDLNGLEVIEVLASAASDTFTTAASLAGTGVTSLILDGGDGDDAINGSDTNDILRGGAGVDIINGGAGNDTIVHGPGDESALQGGEGNDTLVWNDGDGNDKFAGQGSTDTLVFNGSGADTLNTAASSTVRANGNTEIDTLTFDAENKIVSTTPSTIAVGGVTRLTHVNFEQLNPTRLLNAPPQISMTSPTVNPTLTATTPFITVAGTAADETGIVSVTWANDRGGSGAATGTTSWSVSDLPLFSGVNVLTVTVRDASGNQASDILTVTVNVFSYTMAEGATGGFFDTDILIANPNNVVAPVTITYLKGDGTTTTQQLDLPATSRTTIAVDRIAGLENTEVSSTVTSNQALPLVVERTMRWDATGYGAHTERATDAPTKTWYFAEGSQGFFQTFVLLANPGSVSNDATITFLLENGAPVVKRYTLAPTSRQTIDAGAIPELANQSFGITTTVTFLPATGRPVTKTHVVPAGRRLTLNIAAEDASLASGPVGTHVTSTQPILVERAQYWPFSPDRWYEAHNSFGGTSLGRRWGLAEGRVGGPESYQTYILLANADATQSAQVTITFLRTDGTTAVKDYTVPPTSRVNVHVNSMVPELANESFGAVVQVTSGAGIFVQRALYSDARGVAFAAGTNALATRLP